MISESYNNTYFLAANLPVIIIIFRKLISFKFFNKLMVSKKVKSEKKY